MPSDSDDKTAGTDYDRLVSLYAEMEDDRRNRVPRGADGMPLTPAPDAVEKWWSKGWTCDYCGTLVTGNTYHDCKQGTQVDPPPVENAVIAAVARAEAAERQLHYALNEGWNCQTKLEITVVALCDMLGIPHHEHHRLADRVSSAEAAERERDGLREQLTGRDAELLRIRTTQARAAHELEKVKFALGCKPDDEVMPHIVAERLREQLAAIHAAHAEYNAALARRENGNIAGITFHCAVIAALTPAQPDTGHHSETGVPIITQAEFDDALARMEVINKRVAERMGSNDGRTVLERVCEQYGIKMKSTPAQPDKAPGTPGASVVRESRGEQKDGEA